MQVTSTIIRAERTEQAIEAGSVRFRERQADFKERQAEVAALLDTILTEGKPEVWADSTPLCTNYKLRPGFVGDDRCQAQITQHAKGIVIRFWVYPGNFEVKVRDLVLLPEGKGWDIWLMADGRLFPHEGKYVYPAITILGHYFTGR